MDATRSTLDLRPPSGDDAQEAPARDYERIALAIEFLVERVGEQPSLEEVAAHVHLSAPHFQRLFTRWAGVSPKRFLQVLTVEKAKALLRASQPVLEAAWAVGLSSGSRLHDHFVRIEALSPGEYRDGGRGLQLVHGGADTPMGPAWAVLTPRGIGRLEFLDASQRAQALEKLRRRWPAATLVEDDARIQRALAECFAQQGVTGPAPTLHIEGTAFQVQVWKALIRIPPGSLASYAQIAQAVGRPRAARAVGQAVGDNPVAMLIPCHRVIQGSGLLGGYRWGRTRKLALNLRESVQAQALSEAQAAG